VPPRISDDKRAAILADIKAGTLSRNAIARQHSVSVSTVTKLAKDSGNPNAFDRSQTKKATEAKAADDKARIAEIQSRLLDLSEAALTQTLAELADLKADRAATVLGIALDKYRALQTGSDTRSLSDVDAWLDHMLDR
jgi:transposase-like protein